MGPQTTTLARLAAVIEPSHHRTTRDTVITVNRVAVNRTAIALDVEDAHIVITLDEAERISLRELLA